MEDLNISENPQRKATASSPPRRGKTHTKRRAYPFQFRLRAVKLYLEEGYQASEIAEHLGISTHSLYKWTKRYRESGEEGLRVKHRRKPKKRPPSAVREKIVETKRKHPGFGIKRISQTLRRFLFLKASPETVRQTLHEEKLMDRPKQKPKRNPPKPRFFERARPNQLWQTDIFTFRLAGRNAYLIVFMDDHSRYVTGLGMYRSQTAENVIETYRLATSEYGVPKEMLTDNGRQYTNWRGTTRFESELKKDRVHHIKSRPHHPMTLGKAERFWKTIWEEFLSRAQFESFESARERIQLWTKHYSHRRPHQGIGGLCPADRFFEVADELRQVIEQGIQENILELALRGEPRRPFYMVGRMDGQSVVMQARKGKLMMTVNDAKQNQEQELVYDLNDGDLKHEDEEDRKENPPAVQYGGEVAGGVVALDGAPQAGGNLPGTVGDLDDAEQLAEPSVRGHVAGARAEGGGVQEVSGARPEAREAVRTEREAETFDRPDTPQPAFRCSPGSGPRDESVRSDPSFPERSLFLEGGATRPEYVGPTGPQACRPDPEGPTRGTECEGCRGPVGHLPQDVLRMGEPCSGGDAAGPPGPGGWSSERPGGSGEERTAGADRRTGEGTSPGEAATDYRETPSTAARGPDGNGGDDGFFPEPL